MFHFSFRVVASGLGRGRRMRGRVFEDFPEKRARSSRSRGHCSIVSSSQKRRLLVARSVGLLFQRLVRYHRSGRCRSVCSRIRRLLSQLSEFRGRQRPGILRVRARAFARHCLGLLVSLCWSARVFGWLEPDLKNSTGSGGPFCLPGGYRIYSSTDSWNVLASLYATVNDSPQWGQLIF